MSDLHFTKCIFCISMHYLGIAEVERYLLHVLVSPQKYYLSVTETKSMALICKQQGLS